MSNTRFIYDYDEQRERAYYREMLDTLEAHTGIRMRGMGGPAHNPEPRIRPTSWLRRGFSITPTGSWTTSRSRCGCGPAG